jgi:Protein of unknown function (DUF2867)
VPRISLKDFYALPLRVHAFLADVPLHDVWAVDLPRTAEPVTLAEFNPFGTQHRAVERPLSPARALFDLRLILGRMFALEAEPQDAAAASFVSRLTPEDRAHSLAEPRAPAGMFRVVYRFENEALLEVHNRTVHGAMATALLDTAQGYRFYIAVYVVNTTWFTPIYMALIDPFRRLIIYPAMLKNIRAAWLERSEADRAPIKSGQAP